MTPHHSVDGGSRRGEWCDPSSLREQEELADSMPNAELKIIHSDAGHDGFLLEQDQVAAHIKSFLYSHD